MNRVNGFLDFAIDKSYEEAIFDKTIIKISPYKNIFFLKNKKLFYKESSFYYLEVLGSAILNYLEVNHIDYDLARFKFDDFITLGVVSKDYSKEGYLPVNFNEIIENYLKEIPINLHPKNPMNLDFIKKALEYRYQNYPNKDIIIDNIFNNLIKYLCVDLLIGNYDNGPFNYEILESKNHAMLAPYGDFGLTFNFNKTTRFTISDNEDYSILGNIRALLNSKYDDIFISMYERLEVNKLLEIIDKMEVRIPDNLKNILYLSYARHYDNIGNIKKLKKKR